MTKQTASLSARSSIDDIIDLYKRGVDRALLRENLKKSSTGRVRALQQMQQVAEELRLAGRGIKTRNG